MASGGNRPVATQSQASEGERADDGGSSLVDDDTRLLAARISQKLHNTGLACEIFNLVPTDKAVLSRDRIFVLLGLTSLTVLAWSYLLWLSTDMSMGGMDMTGLRMIPSGFGLMVPANIPWRAMEFAFVFVMWIVMMVGMMTPSAAPMFLMYSRVGRLTEAQGAPFTATVWFAAGYLLVWIAFALLATMVQWAFERSELLVFTMASTDNRLAGLLFVVAGLYQWTSLNELCLAQCQRPFEFVMRHGGYRRDAPGSVMLGLRHGAYCVGCCWTLMALLLVGGVMNLLWIVLLALFALLERVTSMGTLIARLAGIVLIAAGAWLFATGMS
jgi:predicted metal-binding membrane protein